MIIIKFYKLKIIKIKRNTISEKNQKIKCSYSTLKQRMKLILIRV